MSGAERTPIDSVRSVWELASATERRDIWSLVLERFHADAENRKLHRQEELEATPHPHWMSR